jgi:hypothetical protein
MVLQQRTLCPSIRKSRQRVSRIRHRSGQFTSMMR